MSKDINETTQLKESNEPQTRNNLNNKEEQNQSQQGNSSLYNDPQYRALLNHFGGKIPRLRPELQELKEQVLKYGTDIMDDEDEKKYADRPYFEKLGHKLYKYYAIFEHYLHAFLAVAVAIYIIYYTNLFYQLYYNPKIKRYYLYACAILFIIVIITFMYVYLYLPYIEKYKQMDMSDQPYILLKESLTDNPITPTPQYKSSNVSPFKLFLKILNISPAI